VCKPRQEGHVHAKRHATFTMNKRGIPHDEIFSEGLSIWMHALLTIIAICTVSLYLGTEGSKLMIRSVSKQL
jgi:hypothetical protein